MEKSPSYLLRSAEYLKLAENQKYIRESMDVDFMLNAMDMLYAAQLVEYIQHQNFMEEQLSTKQAEFFFDLLITGTSYRYEAFCDFCKEEHPEMFKKLYVSDYSAASDSEYLSDSLGTEVCDDNGSSSPIAISRCNSPPQALLNMDRQSAVMDINVIPVLHPQIASLISRTKTVYATSHPVRGVAMLFFNIHFIDRNFPTRTGAEHDLTNLSQLFHQLNYNVKVFRDMTRQEILRELDSQRQNQDHANFGSFVLGFSTHGGTESKSIACSDGKSLYMHEIYTHFDSTHCPYLAGKPKFIFFDASLGLAHDRAVALDKALGPPNTFEPIKKQLTNISFSLGNIRLDTLKPIHVDAPSSSLASSNVMSNSASSGTSRIANKSDFIIAMSTVDGYVSWRRNSHGCWFSRIMVEVFQKHACDHHLIELLKIIRRKLSYIETKTGYKQVNMTMDTSLKHLYFFPGVKL